MQIFNDLPSAPLIHPTAITIGKFDGVHAGHRKILQRLVELAHDRDLQSLVLSFDRHPLSVLAPEFCPPQVSSLDERIERIAANGVDATVILPFTESVANQEPEDFVADILVQRLKCALILVGEDFHFGHHGRGDVALLRRMGTELGFEVVIIPDVLNAEGTRVSTSIIRAAIAKGDVKLATELLGTPPTASGIIVHGAKRGRELGFPTANLGEGTTPEGMNVPLTGVLPEDGVYAGYLQVEDAADHWTAFPAAISVGTNPTFGAQPRIVEAYAIDVTGADFYDLRARVAFVERLRGMESFTDLAALVEQMHRDVAKARALLIMNNA